MTANEHQLFLKRNCKFQVPQMTPWDNLPTPQPRPDEIMSRIGKIKKKRFSLFP